MPLEYYPPVTNMLDVLGNEENLNLKVWSTENVKSRIPYVNINLNKIKRTAFPSSGQNRFFRLFFYLWFNVKVFIGLIIFNPKVVFYYESYSVGPVYWYLKCFGKKKKLVIHYHEYFDQAWYDQGMALVSLYYKYEKRFLWQKADWISHTNSFRLDLFKAEHQSLEHSKLHVLSNFPPESWSSVVEAKTSNNLEENNILKIVYIGSLSLEHTYIEEFCIWVIAQKGRVVFDIYAFNCSSSLINYLKRLNSKYINFNEDGVEYNEIPNLLANYNIGVILYKATTPNAKYCASNKLFEYLVCGLEVWVSKEQEGTVPYINVQNRPIVKAVDFKNLKTTLIEDYYNSLNLPFLKTNFSCKKELKPLVHVLKD
jgi:hypothetical protein